MKYIIRLDDACERRDIKKWNRIENILDEYNIKPLVGVIPHCEDSLMEKYPNEETFWETVASWVEKKWIVALHGYSHVCITEQGGINPVNKRSEFAGVKLEIQKNKIQRGVEIFRNHGIDPKVFFAPSHTFDLNTIIALKECSNIRIISDTIANKPYTKWGITFVPQQSGKVRKLPFNMVTFCYHPNTINEQGFISLEKFLKVHKKDFIPFPVQDILRKESILDRILREIYFLRRRE